MGNGREAVLPSPAAQSPLQLERLAFVGLLLGLALRQRETTLPLSLPAVVWKRLVGEAPVEADLRGYDELCWRSLQKLRAIDSEGVDEETFAEVIFDTFRTQLSDGSEVELVPGGSSTPVTFANRGTYCDEVAAARLLECARQCEAMLRGISAVIPRRLLPLFTWRQLELLCCGAADVSVDVLRARTRYGVGVSAAQRHVRHFWSTLRAFSPEQRSLFLRFVWGRSRLPSSAAEWGETRFTIHTKQTARPDACFPVAHTCFFSLELPAYSSAAVCRERLLYAITNCQAIDIDTTSGARENRAMAAWSSDDEDEAAAKPQPRP